MGYTKQDSSFLSQAAYYLAIKDALGNNQLRSVDSTGTRLAMVADGRCLAYIEGRKLKKLGGAWNIIPSSTIINAAGSIATHIDGNPFSEDVVWNFKKYKQGYNPNVARDVLAAFDCNIYDKCLGALKQVIGKEKEYLENKLQKAFR
jgi:hypothetical protein